MPRIELFSTPIDLVGIQQCMDLIKTHGLKKFAYVVTPNVDHIVRINENKGLIKIYNTAILSLCDSKVIKILAKSVCIRLPDVIRGSDLTRALFESIIKKNDNLLVIGSNQSAVSQLKKKYGLEYVNHFIPSMGFINNKTEIASCVEFVVNHPSRYIFLAVGSPQQEILAYEIYRNGKAKGLGVCVGASINFLTGVEKRAPAIVQKFALEWLYRLIQNPRRLWRRYLVDDIKIFPIFLKYCVQKLLFDKKNNG